MTVRKSVIARSAQRDVAISHFLLYPSPMPDKVCAVYILANPNRTVLYTGVTSDLPKRIWEHKHHIPPDSFTARYNATALVWYETMPDIRAAIALEKRIKAGSRAKKEALIQALNPGWRDLSDSLLG